MYDEKKLVEFLGISWGFPENGRQPVCQSAMMSAVPLKPTSLAGQGEDGGGDSLLVSGQRVRG